MRNDILDPTLLKKKESKSSDVPARIANEIRELVARGTLSQGLQLRQEDLATRFDVSRVPVREALKLLTAEGVVEHHTNRGFFVANLSSEEATQLYRIRHLLEVELMSSVQWPTKQQLAILEAHLAKLEIAMAGGNPGQWVGLHREFYQVIFELSPRKVLVREVLRMLRLTDRYRSLAMRGIEADDLHAVQESHLILALATRNRQKLLKVFEEDRSRIEGKLLAVLHALGL